MSRFSPYLGIVAALAFGAFIAALSSSITVVRAPATMAPHASSTLSVLSGLTPPSSAPASPESNANATAVTPAEKIKAAPTEKKKTAPALSRAAPVAVPASSSSVSESAALDASASALRAALVNILCDISLKGGPHTISGSGVFVDSKGIILTNAHIAEYFLLANRGASCSIRSGSPATDRYRAALIFISPAWLHDNADVISETAPSGTGEYDFAFLAVTSSATENALPASFPSVPLGLSPLEPNAAVVIGSYGAQFLDQSQIQTALSPTLVFGSVKDVFTFNTNTIDVLALGGSAAAQEGSSGGGVADASGALAGTITTSTVEGATATRSLDAITASYIRADYASETGEALDLLLSEPTASSVINFAPQVPALEALIIAHLP